MKSVFIIGCGDIGQRVGVLCRNKNIPVAGLARSDESAAGLKAAGIIPVRGDLARPESLKNLPTAEATIFYFAPPPSEGKTDPLIRNLLSAMNANSPPKQIVLISTTAVYGDCKGEWITEAQPTNPQTARGQRRLDAEMALRDWSSKTGVPIVILRVGGIYGPGRLPIERIKKGLPILNEAESPFTNRIHQDDLAQTCLAAVEHGKNGEVYNVSDGQPSTMSRYFKELARASGLPLPPEISLEEAKQVMSAGMLSYLAESRRLSNEKILSELKLVLKYPSLELGLGALAGYEDGKSFSAR